MSIFENFGSIVDTWLTIDETWNGSTPRFGHRSSLNRLVSEHVAVGNGEHLVNKLYDKLLCNWDQKPSNGQQNWRHTQNLHLGENSKSLEVTLQRIFMRANNDQNWANEVPVASGVAGTGPDSVDFVHVADNEYSMIELKWPQPNSGENPLKAAIQVLRYGLAYVFSRVNAEKLQYEIENKPILKASQVHLRVLAPQHFYDPFNTGDSWLKKLESALNQGIESLAKANDFSMSFAYEQFPADFKWDLSDCSGDKQEQVVEAFQNRKCF